ncbi:MAG: pirin family protein [Alphaproteobacteria bacterium]|nr:pirin family protein [Alphaproteobacteria bacterium]
MKKIAKITRKENGHWVGDGFPVRTLFSYHHDGAAVSPFLLLDYAGPLEFAPADAPRGVGFHPHRGFETVTIAYQGEVDHRDTAGHSGTIRPGEVQWMTAARGVLHEEMHSAEFTRKGGVFEAVQLWVNLPAADKMTDPRYQALTLDTIPVVPVDGGTVRVIAGDYHGTKGPAHSVTPVNLWDIALKAGGKLALNVPAGHSAMLLAMRGPVRINGQEIAGSGELAQFEPNGTHIDIEAVGDAALLFMGGEPIGEPIAGYGPFVMNTQAEIEQAIADFETGKF